MKSYAFKIDGRLVRQSEPIVSGCIIRCYADPACSESGDWRRGEGSGPLRTIFQKAEPDDIQIDDMSKIKLKYRQVTEFYSIPRATIGG